ncbi:organic cation/carnitine transporter 2-like [Synchiropus picturatus]
MRDYVESIRFLGQWGRFQRVIFFLLCTTTIPNGFGAFTLVFLADTPEHRCRIPEVNLTHEWRGAIIPELVGEGTPKRSSCSRYRLDVVRNLSAQGLGPGDVNLTSLEQERCKDGFFYSTDIYTSTIVSEFDLVCENKWKQPLTNTLFFLGVLVGSFFSGQVSDRFGRKPVLFATVALQTICTFLKIFSVSWAMFTVLLFINGLGQMSNYVSALVLGSEILTGNVRILYSSLGTCFGFALGYILLPLVAYFMRSWKSLLIALTIPGLFLFPLWWFIPESPRFLLSQGKVEEAEAVVRKAARWNNVIAPGVIFTDYTVSQTKEAQLQEQFRVVDLFRHRAFRLTSILLIPGAFTLIATYYGLCFNTANLHADPYISCLISAVVEIPAYVTAWLGMLYLPRRLSMFGSLVLGALPLFFIQLVPEEWPAVAITLEMVGKLFITAGSCLLFAYSAELYPTCLRNTATGACNSVARLGSCISPFLFELRHVNKFLPYIILGTLSMVSAAAMLFLPETYGRPLPDTVEQMARSKSINFPCRRTKTHRSRAPPNWTTTA